MLLRVEDVVALQECHDGTDEDVLEDLARHASQGDRPVVAWVVVLPFLEDWGHQCRLPVRWNGARLQRGPVDDGQDRSNFCSQLSQYSWRDPVWSRCLVRVERLQKLLHTCHGDVDPVHTGVVFTGGRHGALGAELFRAVLSAVAKRLVELRVQEVSFLLGVCDELAVLLQWWHSRRSRSLVLHVRPEALR